MSKIFEEARQRIIQEHVPGKQVTLAHVIASPQPSLFASLGLSGGRADAMGIMTVSPGEGAIIAADIATKSAQVDIVALERTGGALLLMGDIASVEAALDAVISYFAEVLRYSSVAVTRS